MKSEDEFDDLLRSKFSEDAFPFSDDKWARMEEMIIAKEDARRRRRFLLFYFYGFLTAVLILTPIIWFSLSKAGKKHTPELSQKTNHKQNELVTANKNKSTHEATTNQKQADSTHVSVAQQTKNEVAKQLIVEQKAPLFTYKRKNTRNKATQNNNVVMTDRFVEMNEGLDSDLKTKTSEIQPNPIVVEPILIRNGEEDSKKDSTSLTLNEKGDSLPADKKDSTTLAIHVPIKDSTLTNPVSVDSTNNGSHVADSSRFFISLGGIYHFGFSSSDGLGLSPMVNIGMNFPLKNNWNFSTSLGYFQVGHLDFTKSFSDRTYDFGYREKVTEIQQKALYYVSLPLNLEKNYARFSYFVGLTPSYMIANKTAISTFERNSLSESEKTSTKSYRNGHGLNSFDLLAGIGLKIKLSRKFAIGAQYQFGLIDVRKNTYSLVNKVERNQFAALQLIYKFK